MRLVYCGICATRLPYASICKLDDPEAYAYILELIICELITRIEIFHISRKIALRWISQDFIGD